MTLQYWVLSDVSFFVTASVIIFNYSASSWTAFLFTSFLIAVLSALYIVQARLVVPQLNYINVVRLRERHDYADLTSLALYDFSVSKSVSINLVHRCIAQQCMTLK